MISFRSAFLLLTAIAFHQAAVTAASPSKTAAAYQLGGPNQFVDKLIAIAKKIIVEKKVEPIHLPDEIHNKNVGLITFGIQVDHGKLYGLSTLSRAGNSSLEWKGNAEYKVDVKLGLKKLIASYSLGVHAFNIYSGGHVTADADDVIVHLVADFCLDGACSANISTLAISNVKYEAHISYLPGFDWLASHIIDLFANGAFKAKINTAIENEAKIVLTHAIDGLFHH